ncbi:VanZ family protein [Streptomyces sp. NPDC088785]|uniref:VanZ family protein n=1 Tax=Streptomyces sp. NPDC088785 TaxID=3365897 RepID=UPI003808A703
MFSAIFRHHVGHLAVCTLTALVLGGAAWALARHRGRPHGLWWAALVCTLTGVFGVTFMDAGPAGGACVVNHRFAEPFHTTQGVWNLAMMVPVGAFAVLAVRRPLPVLAGVVALPAAIEFAQATVDGLGRVCDSADAEMNIAGGLVGLAVATGVLAVRQSLVPWGGAKGALIAAAALLLLGTGVAGPMLSFTHVDGTGLSAASAEQRRAVVAAVTGAFGDRYTIGNVYEDACGTAWCDQVIFQVRDRRAGASREFGDGSLSWPGGKHLSVELASGDGSGGMGCPVHAAEAPTGPSAARRVALTYARERYPWADGATTTRTAPAGDGAPSGWTTTWRWTHRGVLMPRRLDVRVGRDGQVSRIDVTRGVVRAEFPRLALDRREAARAVDRAVTARLRADGNAGAPFASRAVAVKADDFDGTLKPYRLVEVTWQGPATDDDAPGPAPVTLYQVDAMTGRVYDFGE